MHRNQNSLEKTFCECRKIRTVSRMLDYTIVEGQNKNNHLLKVLLKEIKKTLER